MMVGRMWAGRSMLPRRCSSLLSSRTSSTFNPPARDFVSGRCCGASRELQGSNDIISSPSNIRWQSTRASANASAKAAHNPSGFTFPGPRSLKDIVRLPLLEKKNAGEVGEIWRKYHEEHKSSVADLLSDNQYGMMRQRSKRCPYFVLPVHRDTGYFTLILQWQDRHCMLTFLEDYRKNPMGAEPYVTFTVYDDFVISKQLALVRGDVGNKLTRKEAAGLWALIKRFYVEELNHFDVVVKFNERSNEFQFEQVLRVAGK